MSAGKFEKLDIDLKHLRFHARALVLERLVDRHKYEWSLQGFGMLRTYFSKEVRMHIWNDQYRVPNVSDMHTHPWGFTSHIVKGNLVNMLFTRVEGVVVPNFVEGRIVCGTGGGLDKAKMEGTPIRGVALAYAQSVEHRHIYVSGETYSQDADEIHRTVAARGTVTLVERRFVKEDQDRALVFWPIGQEWVPAEPRPATTEEIDAICTHSLKKWFKEKNDDGMV